MEEKLSKHKIFDTLKYSVLVNLTQNSAGFDTLDLEEEEWLVERQIRSKQRNQQKAEL